MSIDSVICSRVQSILQTQLSLFFQDIQFRLLSASQLQAIWDSFDRVVSPSSSPFPETRMTDTTAQFEQKEQQTLQLQEHQQKQLNSLPKQTTCLHNFVEQCHVNVIGQEARRRKNEMQENQQQYDEDDQTRDNFDRQEKTKQVNFDETGVTGDVDGKV